MARRSFIWRRSMERTPVLIALGQTATVLAYDLSEAGLQAIDPGHVDVEYEWYRMGEDQGSHPREVRQ